MRFIIFAKCTENSKKYPIHEIWLFDSAPSGRGLFSDDKTAIAGDPQPRLNPWANNMMLAEKHF